MSKSGPGSGASAIDRTRYATIRHQLARMDVDSHVALFYQSEEAKHTAATAYIDVGLGNGERCLYIHDESDRATVESQFRAAGIDIERRLDAGDLRFVDGCEYYLADGFDPDRMTEDIEDAATRALEEGYSGLRVAGENTWSFELEETFDSIIEFEATFERNCESIPAQTLCQYNLERFDESAIVKALRTHRHLIYRDTVCENPYYVDPAKYVDATDSGSNAVAVLEQAYELSNSREEVRAQRQRLEVINRIFRHNIRNDMNVLLSYLELLEEDELVAPAGRDKVTTMKATLQRFIDTSERARYIEQTLQDSRVASVDLRGVVTDIVAELDAEFPAADFEVDAADEVRVVADEHIDVAVEELLRNAVVHADSDAPAVEVALTAAEDPGSAQLTVTNSGSLPVSTRRALSEGAETQLRHNDGLGLWLVKWLVEESYGKLELDDDRKRDRCRARVALPTTAPGAVGGE